jgi:glycosyltransferase involved in cell wall biosynthesis
MVNGRKIKLFWATDSPVVGTGFGRVSYELITRLLKTGRYEIHVMGTNDRGEPHELRGMKDLFIYPLTNVEGDPYGAIEMPYIIRKVNPDLIFSLNDVWVWTGDERNPESNKWFERHLKGFKPYIPWVGYFPVDGRPWEQKWVDQINEMSYAVTFSDYGYETLMNTPGVDKEKTKLIHHGASVDKFFPLPKDVIKRTRKEKLNIQNENLFLVGTVSRNQPRKNVPLLIQSFKMFSDGYRECKECGNYESTSIPFKDCELCGCEKFKIHPGVGNQNTALYLHMNPMDMRGHRLYKVLEDNSLQNVILRPQHHVAKGVPIEELNELYNAMDLFVMCTYAGGYELPIVEAQAAGTPVISTRTTCVTEHLNDGKGFLINPEAAIIMDDANHCHKHLMSKRGLVDMLFKLYKDRELLNSVIEPGLEYAHQNNWDIPAQEFDALFQKAMSERVVVSEIFNSSTEQKKVLLINKTKNPGVLLSMIPLAKAAKKEHNAELIIACDPEIGDIINNNKSIDGFVDCNKLWLEGELPNANVQDVSSLIDSYEKNVAKFSGHSWEEAWFKAFNMEPGNLKMDLFFNSNDKKESKKLMPNNDKITVGVCIDHDNPTRSIDITKWNGIINFMSKVDINIIVFGSSEIECEQENVTKIDIKNQRTMACCTSMCDILITLDNSWTIIGKALNKRMIIIQGPRDVSHKIKGLNNELVRIIADKKEFSCMPCWIDFGDKCIVTGTEAAACLQKTLPSSVFKAFLEFKKELEGVEKVANNV